MLLLCGARGIPLLGPSGASAHLRGVAAALAAANHEVVVATPNGVDARGAWDALPGIRAVHTGVRSWRWLGRLRERGEVWDARRLVDAIGCAPGWIWERHSLHCDAGMRLQERLGIPRIAEVNAPLARERALTDPVRDPAFADALERRVLVAATRVITVSSWLVDWCDALGVPRERVRHVPNGTGLTRLGAREATRRELGVEERLVLGFVGSNKPWHGVDRLGALLDALPEAIALAVGGPPGRAAHPRIVALAPQPTARLADLVAAMDVGLAPYTEAAPPWLCPLKLLDYRSQGVPVVSSDVGDARALLGDAGEVLHADASAGAWAAAIRRAAALPRIPRVRGWSDVIAEALAPAAG